MASYTRERQAEPSLTVSLDELQQEVRTHPKRANDPILNAEYKLVASYNWKQPADNVTTGQTDPVIVVPGAPATFVQWKGGVLQPDEILPYADENRFFTRDYPMEPLFRAVLKEGYPAKAFQTLGLVTDRYNLRLLFNFCKWRGGYNNNGPNMNARPPDSFQIDVERIGDRLVVFEQTSCIRYPARPTPIYGRDFEAQCTRPYDDTTKGSFYAIIKYNLDDLSMVVRFNPDCVEDWRNPANQTGSGNVRHSGERPLFDSRLKIIRHGIGKFDFKFIELTTKMQTGKYPNHIWDQMFFGGVKSTYIGWHQDGHCDFPQLLTMDALQGRMREEMPRIKSSMRALNILLWKIIKFIRSRPYGERYSLVYDKIKTPDLIHLYPCVDNSIVAPEGGVLPIGLKCVLEGGFF